MFWDSLLVPSLRVKQSKKNFFFYIVVPSNFTLADVQLLQAFMMSNTINNNIPIFVFTDTHQGYLTLPGFEHNLTV
jgi:hypothetical protein